MMLSKPITDKIVLEVIDKGLNSLGNSAKQALWYYLEKDFNFNSQVLPDIAEFEKALQNFFGIGYNFLDTLFKKYLQEVIVEDIPENQSFAQWVIYLYANKTQ